jgi:hypothetical protein
LIRGWPIGVKLTQCRSLVIEMRREHARNLAEKVTIPGRPRLRTVAGKS